MPVGPRHDLQVNNHIIEAFVATSAANRAAGTVTQAGVAYVIVAGDIGKLCYQSDTGAYYRLTGFGPLVWAITAGPGVGGPPTGAAGGDLSGTYPNPTIGNNKVVTATINNAAVTLAKLANIADLTILGNQSGGAAAPIALTVAQLVAILIGASVSTVAVGNDVRFTTVVPNVQAGATYTFVPGDAGLVVEGNRATAQTFTIDTNANQAIPVNTVIEVFQVGAGVVTIAAAGGVTLRSPGGLVAAASQYSTLSLRQRAIDDWVLSGDLA